MTERTRTRASDASGPLHVVRIVSLGMRAAALDSRRRIANAQLSCKSQFANRGSPLFSGTNLRTRKRVTTLNWEVP